MYRGKLKGQFPLWVVEQVLRRASSERMLYNRTRSTQPSSYSNFLPSSRSGTPTSPSISFLHQLLHILIFPFALFLKHPIQQHPSWSNWSFLAFHSTLQSNLRQWVLSKYMTNPAFLSDSYWTHLVSCFLNHDKNVLIRSVFFPTDLHNSPRNPHFKRCSLFMSLVTMSKFLILKVPHSIWNIWLFFSSALYSFYLSTTLSFSRKHSFPLQFFL